MKKLILIVLLANMSSLKATEQFENSLENWIDSAFTANELTWSNISEDIISLSSNYYKTGKSLESFLEAVNIDKKEVFQESYRLNSKSSFNSLNNLSAFSDDFLIALSSVVFDEIEKSGLWDEFGNHIEVAFLLHELDYWSLECYNPSILSGKLLRAQDKIKSKNLFQKLAAIILTSKMYLHDSYVRQSKKAYEILKTINVDLPENRDQKVFTFTHDTARQTGEPVLDFTEKEPGFIGGEVAMIQYIQRNIIYPEKARELKVQGSVYVQFVVNTDGSIVDVISLNNPGNEITKEAIRVVKSMPRWSPGSQKGKKVRVRYQIPIRFTIY